MTESKFPRGIEIVSSAIIQKDGKIFLAKSPKWSNKWTMPGGHIEAGETIIDSCIREVAEETGLAVKPVEILTSGELIGSKDFHRPAHFIYFDIICDVVRGEVKLEDRELSESGWFTVDDVLKLDLAESYPETLQKYKEYLDKKI